MTQADKGNLWIVAPITVAVLFYFMIVILTWPYTRRGYYAMPIFPFLLLIFLFPPGFFFFIFYILWFSVLCTPTFVITEERDRRSSSRPSSRSRSPGRV